MLICGHCQEECEVSREDLADEVVLSNCCRSDVFYPNGMQFTIWEYEAEERISHAEYLMEARRDAEMMAEMEKLNGEF